MGGTRELGACVFGLAGGMGRMRLLSRSIRTRLWSCVGWKERGYGWDAGSPARGFAWVERGFGWLECGSGAAAHADGRGTGTQRQGAVRRRNKRQQVWTGKGDGRQEQNGGCRAAKLAATNPTTISTTTATTRLLLQYLLYYTTLSQPHDNHFLAARSPPPCSRNKARIAKGQHK